MARLRGLRFVVLRKCTLPLFTTDWGHRVQTEIRTEMFHHSRCLLSTHRWLVVLLKNFNCSRERI